MPAPASVPGPEPTSEPPSEPTSEPTGPASAPVVVTDALIHHTLTRTARGDLFTDGARIAARPEHGRDPGPGTDLIIDGRGASVTPLLVDSVFAAPAPPARDAFDLTPGRPATFAVVDGTVRPDQIARMLVVQPHQLRAVVVHGTVVVRDGVAVRRPGATEGERGPEDPRLGAWTDARRAMTQYLTPDGRYSETRGTTRDAYTGRFWLDGDRITYLDDTGFWAFGQYHDGVLHHAGFVLRRG